MASTQPRPSSLACLACRNKHLKCDGRLPVCARCAETKTECVFVRSRRGIRGRSRRGNTETSAISSSHGGKMHSSPLMAASQQQPRPLSSSSTDLTNRSDTPLSVSGVALGTDEMTDAYYEHFHAAHPFLPPRIAITSGFIQLPPYLRTAMAYVASHYASPKRAVLIDPINMSLLAPVPNDIYKVQSLLLLALASFARLEPLEGANALTQAIETAQCLQLDKEMYVQRLPNALQESCRRTLWELFVVATLVKSILGVDVPFDLTKSDLFLPGDCDDYERNKPQLHLKTLQDMQDRFLSDADFHWSAFAFKIEATRILQTVLETERNAKADGLRETYDACQASISSWWLSLPKNKSPDNAGQDADADECMFFALMVINMASLRINLPRSDLSPSWREATLCSPIQSQSSARHASYHTASALKAANTLSSLIASEGSSRLHTPCSACAIAFGTIVQLPAYLQEPDEIRGSNLKENIQLGLTYLKRMGEVWPMASAVRGQLAALAREVLATPRKRDSGFMSGVQEQMNPSMHATPRSTDRPILFAKQSDTTVFDHTQYVDNMQPASRGDRWLDFARETLTNNAGFGSAHADSLELDGEDSGWLQDLVDVPTDFEVIDDFLQQQAMVR